MRIFLTGGAGYIGSHTITELLSAGHEVVVLDNFSNSKPESLKRVERISKKNITVVNGDVRDQSILEYILREMKCEAVIHFAGLKSVGESVSTPLSYYDNNVIGTHRLLSAMQNCEIKTLVFSSSATVYGVPEQLPIAENHPLSSTNPYGRTKLIIENMLRDLYCSQPNWRIAMLRYFNPVGAHESGLIGEDPLDVPNNLMPFVAQVAVGVRDQLKIWGSDYPTIDGTGVRDYVHVMDLASGHVSALDYLGNSSPQCFEVNLGTGVGYSVLEVLKTFERESGCSIPYDIYPRRDGDVASCYGNSSLAKKLLGWAATRDLAQMCRDHWRWQQLNPKGYP